MLSLLSASNATRNTRYIAPICLLAVEIQHEAGIKNCKSLNCLWTESSFQVWIQGVKPLVATYKHITLLERKIVYRKKTSKFMIYTIVHKIVTIKALKKITAALL